MNRRQRPARPYPTKFVPRDPRIWYPNCLAYGWLKNCGSACEKTMWEVYGVLNATVAMIVMSMCSLRLNLPGLRVNERPKTWNTAVGRHFSKSLPKGPRREFVCNY